MRLARFSLLVGILACFGCSPGPAMIDRIAAPADRAVAQEAITALRSNNIPRLTALAVPEARSRIASLAPALRRNIPSDRSVRVTLAGAWWIKNLRTGADRVTLDYQVRGARRQAFVRLGLTHRNGKVLVAQFQAARLARPMEVTNAFRIAGKGWAHFAFLLFALLTVALIIAALVTLARAPGGRWRWAWALGSLFGFGQFLISWTTGQVSVSPLHIQFLGAQVVRTGPVGPWIVGWSVPLVAIVVLWRHTQTRTRPS